MTTYPSDSDLATTCNTRVESGPPGYKMTTETKIGRGTPPQKWPFFRTLKRGGFAEVADLSKYSALRTAASRAGPKLRRKFSVSKELREPNGNGEMVIRVYRTK